MADWKPEDFAVGDQVLDLSHPDWGIGAVVSAERLGEFHFADQIYNHHPREIGVSLQLRDRCLGCSENAAWHGAFAFSAPGRITTSWREAGTGGPAVAADGGVAGMAGGETGDEIGGKCEPAVEAS